MLILQYFIIKHSNQPQNQIVTKMAPSGGGFRCCVNFIVTSGFTALFVWLGLRVTNPKCSIQEFYIPALNKTANATSNTTIYFDLMLENTNWQKGVYYDDLQLSFYYGPNRTSSPIGNKTIQHFYQGHKKKAHRRELVETHGVHWQAVSQAVSNATVVFRVDLATAVRFKVLNWISKRHKLALSANVEVNDRGNKVKRKGIKLTSGASELRFDEVVIILVLPFWMFVGYG